MSNIAVEAFTLPPAEAMGYFEEKGLKPTWSWTEQLTLNNNAVFTVAKAVKMDVLQDIRNEVSRAISDGQTFAEFRKNLEPRLRAKGWWGKGKDSAGRTVQLGSPHRLKTIYNTNTQSAINTGRWLRQQDNKDEFPYLKYVAILDQSTRPAHRALDGIVRHIDSQFYKKYYPPLGYNCRCVAVAISNEEAKRFPHKRKPNIEPDKGFDKPPGTTWKPKKSKYDSDIWDLSDL